MHSLVHCRPSRSAPHRRRGDAGQATAEYGVVILVGVAFAMALFMLVSGGAFNDVLSGLLKAVLTYATKLVH